jgi:hypothetical protein
MLVSDWSKFKNKLFSETTKGTTVDFMGRARKIFGDKIFIHTLFLPSYISFDLVVSVEKFF